MKKNAIFPGTFDPITFGHVDLVQRALRLFDHITIAMTTGAGKAPTFPIAQRLSLAEELFTDYSQVKVTAFSGLLVDYMQQQNIQFILRGIRTLADIEYEFQLATMNHQIQPDIETIFLPTAPEFTHISSSIVRDIASKGGQNIRQQLALFVPSPVVEAFMKTMSI